MSARLRDRSTRRTHDTRGEASLSAHIASDIHASVAERLDRDSIRYTRTRRAVVDVLAETCRPLTVDRIRAQTGAPVSTVYRALAVLEEIGLVHRLTNSTSEYARFELAEDLLGHHHHLACQQCGTMLDVTLADHLEADLARALTVLATQQQFALESYQLDIIGTCAACRETNPEHQGDRRHLTSTSVVTDSR